MANPVWDGLITYAHFAKLGGSGANSSSFNIARATGAITFIVPALDGTATTVKIQGLDPLDKSTWSDVYAYNPVDGTMNVIDGIPESQYTVLPASAIGTGTFRLVCADAQTTESSVTIIIDRLL